MVSLVVMAVLLSVAVMTLSGSRGKRHLLDTSNGLLDALRRAQSEADRSKEFRGLCFKQDSDGGFYAQIYEPSLGTNRLPANSDCDGSDVGLGYRFPFKPGVSVCASCDANVGVGKSIFFNPQGFTSTENGTRTDFEICLIHAELASGTRAREIEVSALGIIKLLKVGETGSFGGVVVNAGDCL